MLLHDKQTCSCYHDDVYLLTGYVSMMSTIDRSAFFDRYNNRISVSLNCFQLHSSILDETDVSKS